MGSDCISSWSLLIVLLYTLHIKKRTVGLNIHVLISFNILQYPKIQHTLVNNV